MKGFNFDMRKVSIDFFHSLDTRRSRYHMKKNSIIEYQKKRTENQIDDERD